MGGAISLWGNNAVRISRVQSSRENTEYLPGIRLPDNISATHELSDCSEAELIVFVTPSTALREIATRVRNAGSKTMRCCLSCTKGIEHGSGMRMSEILVGHFSLQIQIAVLSGPNLAVEVVRGSTDGNGDWLQLTRNMQLNCNAFSGANISGSIPVMMLSALSWAARSRMFSRLRPGVSDGLGLGDNSKAALITRATGRIVASRNTDGWKRAHFLRTKRRGRS